MSIDDEDLQDLLDAVRKFAESELAPHAQERDQKKHFPVDVMQRAGELGLGGICVAERHGGAELSRAVSVRIFEELARGDTALAAYISIHNMAVWMLDTFAREEVAAEWVPRLCSMETLGSYCLTEPDAGSDAAALRSTARRDGDAYVLDGVSSSSRAPALQGPTLSWPAPATPVHTGSQHSWCRAMRRVCPSAPTSRRWAGTPSRLVR